MIAAERIITNTTTEKQLFPLTLTPKMLEMDSVVEVKAKG